MRRVLVLCGVTLSLIGCGGVAVPAAPGGGNPGATATFEFPDLGGILDGPAKGPSGAQVRVVNTWVAEGGAGGAIDAYATYSPGDNDPPLVTVPFGTASTFFDPTADADGNMVLTFYPSGSKDPDDLIIQQTETLEGSEGITFYVGTSEGLGGEPSGFIQAFFETADQPSFVDGPTPDPGKALLLGNSVGLSDALGDSDDFLYLSVGEGCLFRQGVQPTLGAGEGPQPVGPGSGATYELAPGSYTVTLHRYPSLVEGALDCSNPSVLDVPITMTAGKDAYLFLYSDAGTIKALFLPYGD